MWDDACPPTTKCVEIFDDPNRYDGLCKCKDDFQFNPLHNSNDTYCIKINNSHQLPNLSNRKNNNRHTDSNNAKDEIITSKITTSFEQYQQDPRIKPGPQHVFAGILIPIVLVVIVVGSAFLFKRLHITQRIRNIRRTRRSRPFYEDVMLGSNDTDDPPLI